MKQKKLLLLGALATGVIFMSGCATTAESGDEYHKELNYFLENAKGLEQHTPQAEKDVLPNALLENSKVLYIQTGSAVVDAIELRFGDTEIILATQTANNSSNNRRWEAMKNADDNKELAQKADAEMQELFVDIKNELKSERNAGELYSIVKGKAAQEDFIKYKNPENKEQLDKIKDSQATWLALGEENVKKVYAEQKKKQELAEKKLAEAKAKADEANRKIALVLKYWGAVLAELGGQIAVQQAPAMTKQMAIAAWEKSKPEIEKTKAETVAEFPEVVNVFKIDLNMPNDLASMQKLVESINKELQPYNYANGVAVDRFAYTAKALPWWYESYKAVKEAAGE